MTKTDCSFIADVSLMAGTALAQAYPPNEAGVTMDIGT